jgi:hypothetical protein
MHFWEFFLGKFLLEKSTKNAGVRAIKKTRDRRRGTGNYRSRIGKTTKQAIATGFINQSQKAII